MKRKHVIQTIMLGTFLLVPSIVFSRPRQDSLVMARIFGYQRNYTPDISGKTSNVYMKWRFNTVKRNAALWCIPHMYTLAQGSRSFIMESYSRMTFEQLTKYDTHRQLVCGTIPHHSRTMPTIQKFITPCLYDEMIYKDHILSPFHQSNRKFYKYRLHPLDDGTVEVRFTPRAKANTQLVSGQATVDYNTGRIMQLVMDGEFDMVRFRTESTLGDEDVQSLLPRQCKTDVEFKFLGNHITSSFEAVYDCPITLPDTVNVKGDRELMDSLRPTPLTMQDQYIYAQYDKSHPHRDADTATIEQPVKHKYDLLDLATDLGDNLISSIRKENSHFSIRLSPLINPQYLSYSHSKGLAYKIRLRSRYAFNSHRYFTFNPTLGYNFKQRQVYFTAPLRFTYNPKREGYVEVEYGNGNQIRHASIEEEIRRHHQDTIELKGLDLNRFKDNHLRVVNNIVAYRWLAIEGGFVYHRRAAVAKDKMHLMGMPIEYRSFAPMLSFRLTPWRNGPTYSIDYERGIKGVDHSGIDYERWEFDGSMKWRLSRMRTWNFRVGAGVYTRRKDNYFVDFLHFRDNNLPESWDDDWTGNFQLLDSRWYNTSKYYVRHNLSYESPLLLATRLPLVGRYIERERIYLSNVLLKHTRPYTEVGYGFTHRWVSVGLFAGFLNAEFNEIECKFTLELFRRW